MVRINLNLSLIYYTINLIEACCRNIKKYEINNNYDQIISEILVSIAIYEYLEIIYIYFRVFC